MNLLTFELSAMQTLTLTMTFILSLKLQQNVDLIMLIHVAGR